MVECIGHGDVVRASDLHQRYSAATSTRTCWAVTGSYDHTVRLWNVDPEVDDSTNRCLAIMEHGAPVEAVLFAVSTHPQVPVWIVSVGGTHIKVWNPLSGKCVCELQAQHRKTITSMIMIRRIVMDESASSSPSYASRLVTAGLDGLLRIHTWNSETGEIHQIHGLSLLKSSEENVAITALAANKAGDRIAIGFATGTIWVRQMGPSIQARKRTRPPPAGTYAFFQRGKNATPIAGEYVLMNPPKKRKLTKFDIALRQFRYADALDEALSSRIPSVVVAVLEELGKRRGLSIALSNRDEETLEPILAFLVKYMTRPRFTGLLLGLANKIIDIYGNVAGQSEVVDELFNKLKDQVAQECKTQKLLTRLVGQIDAILAN
jgi:U3 small nucleolar RNA-associated protein 15